MRLKQWAEREGISTDTAYRWVREGCMPVPFRRVGPSGRTILVDDDHSDGRGGAGRAGVGLYARVSSSDQRADLDRQMDRLMGWAVAAGLDVVRAEKEIASGVDGSRPKVARVLSDPEVTVVVVEHRDRLGRMNIGLVEAALAATGRRLVVLDDGEVEDDLVRDMTEVMTSFCARLYGRRSARDRAAAGVEAARSASFAGGVDA